MDEWLDCFESIVRWIDRWMDVSFGIVGWLDGRLFDGSLNGLFDKSLDSLIHR